MRIRLFAPNSLSELKGAMTENIVVDFNKPIVVGNELQYMAEAIAFAKMSGDGPFTKKASTLLEMELGVPKVLLTTSCTHALEMFALLLDIQPGDEVIIPSFTFVSTVNAFVLRGAKPVFSDVRPDTLNLDESRLEARITPRTKAIVPVHYAGVGCEMDAILEIANRHAVSVVEDNAHGLFGKYKGKYLGTFGVMAAQSFHETKNFSCGEGGALLINDPKYTERAEIIREKGTNRSRFFRGQVDKYTWVDVGSSYLPSDILAAYLYGQLEQREKIQTHRKKVWDFYNASLADWAKTHEVQLPHIPAYVDQAYHMFYMLLPTLELRQGLISYLRQRGIISVFHYLPLHLSDMGLHFGGKPGDCPVTERVSDQLIRLPFHNALTESEQKKVVEAIMEFDF
jgi:dTDP-4-amino-4,6-dideoxygalactose transaminase